MLFLNKNSFDIIFNFFMVRKYRVDGKRFLIAPRHTVQYLFFARLEALISARTQNTCFRDSVSVRLMEKVAQPVTGGGKPCVGSKMIELLQPKATSESIPTTS